MMSVVTSESDVFQAVREIIADCLAIEPDEILRESHFRHDLGGESIDDLDLSFRIEKHFGIKAPFARLMNLQDWQFDKDGRLLPECAARWRSRYPELDWSRFTGQPGPQSPDAILTVDTICKLVERAINEQSGAALP